MSPNEAAELLPAPKAPCDAELKAKADELGSVTPRTSELASAKVADELLGKLAVIWETSDRVTADAFVWLSPWTTPTVSPRLTAEVLKKATAFWAAEPNVPADAAACALPALNETVSPRANAELRPNTDATIDTSPRVRAELSVRTAPRIADVTSARVKAELVGKPAPFSALTTSPRDAAEDTANDCPWLTEVVSENVNADARPNTATVWDNSLNVPVEVTGRKAALSTEVASANVIEDVRGSPNVTAPPRVADELTGLKNAAVVAATSATAAAELLSNVVAL